MAVVNRDLDVSQQKVLLQDYVSSLAIAASHAIVAVVAAPCVMKSAWISTVASANSAVVQLDIIRFIVGTGQTIIVGAATTLTITAVGTSGIQGFSTPAAGSTLLNLQANDMVGLKISGGASGAVTGAMVSLVLQNTQDYVSLFGSST